MNYTGQCRTLNDSDTGRIWDWSNWRCLLKDSVNDCPSGTIGSWNEYDESNDTNITGGGTCIGDSCVLPGGIGCIYRTYRQKAKCRWTIDRYNEWLTNDNDLSLCCSGERNGRTDKLCHPDYCLGNSNCASWYSTYCGRGNNIFSDTCNKMGSTYTTERNAILANNCVGTNLSQPACDTWCKSTEANEKTCATRVASHCTVDQMDSDGGWCKNAAIYYSKFTPAIDTAAETFCSVNTDDPFCSCLNIKNQGSVYPPITDPILQKILAKPQCYTKECTSGSSTYLTYNMRNNKDCPHVNVCQNTLNVIGNIDLNMENIEQKCNQEIIVNKPVEDTETDDSVEDTETDDSVEDNSTIDIPITIVNDPEKVVPVEDNSTIDHPFPKIQSIFNYIGLENIDPKLQTGIFFLFMYLIYVILISKFFQNKQNTGGNIYNKLYEN
jgi:hypothetical protein